MVECFPSPELSIAQKAINKENEPEYVCLSEENKFSALVFKTIADPFVGKMSLFRVITGKLTDDTTVLNVNKNKKEKLSNIFFIRGKNQIPTNEIIAGDIGGVSKLQFTETGDTLADSGFNLTYDKLNFKEPTISMAILPKAKGDEDKISGALNKLLDEDKAFKVTRDVENAELIISCLLYTSPSPRDA